MILIRMSSDGPTVSFRGSPTVSPTTAAAWVGPPFRAHLKRLIRSASGIIPGAAAFPVYKASMMADKIDPIKAPHEVGSKENPLRWERPPLDRRELHLL